MTIFAKSRYTHDVIEQAPETPVEPAFSHFFDFPFDPFQLEAMEQIRHGRSVMVAAPTSSGKTVVAEYALWQALRSGTRAIYTAPIKALSNQKRRDLEALFPGKVGLLTGDRSESPDAPIVVMTTEVLRNMLVDDAVSLQTVSTVVFDEIHYLADPERGTVWEEAIVMCPGHIRLVCLSATIANAEEVAAWIAQTHREIALVRHDERPVPLEHFYFTRNRLHLVRDQNGKRRSVFLADRHLPAPHPPEVVRALAARDLLPAIWFAFSRQGAEDAAGACVRAVPPVDRETIRIIESSIGWTLDSLPAEDRSLPQLSSLVRLLRQGVGFHHAGLLPPLKELVERLFAEGLLSVVASTDTLAVGLNMPARTVVISNLSRPVGGMLTPNDFSQLIGRAGRRGIDKKGAVVMLPASSYSFEDAYHEVCSQLLPIESTFRLRYSTVLASVEEADGRLDRLIRASLRQYQMKARMRRHGEEAAGIKEDLAAAGLDKIDAGLREYLQLQASLSASQKEQKSARNARRKMPKNRDSIRRQEVAQREVQGLTLRVRSHPSHGLASQIESGDAGQMAQLRRLGKLETAIRLAEQECDEHALETAEAVRTILENLGYVENEQLTTKGQALREIVAGPGIVLTELHEAGAFEGLRAAELAEAISWFACDSRRKRNSYRLPPHLFRLRRECIDRFVRIVHLEEAEQISLAEGPSDWFYGVALDWCQGKSIEEITGRVATGEGDIVGLLNKTVDLLDQFEQMLAVRGDDRLLTVAAESRRLLVRGLVAMVRFGDRVREAPLGDGQPEVLVPVPAAP